MILSHQHRFILFCNGRTGTTSLEAALQKYDESGDFNCGALGLWKRKHIPPAVMKAFLPERIWQSYFKIVFVRHPQDWFVSQYKHNFRHKGIRTILKALLQHPWNARSAIGAYNQHRSRALKNVFDVEDVEFLFCYLRQYRGLPNTPSLLQSSYVYDVEGNRLVDFIGRFERFANDVETLKQRISIEFELPHLNKSSHEPFRQSLTPAASALIRELYAVDFANFEYT